MKKRRAVSLLCGASTASKAVFLQSQASVARQGRPKARGARPRATGEPPRASPGGVRRSAKPGPWARFSFSARPRRSETPHGVGIRKRRATGREDRKGRRGGRRDHASADARRHEGRNVLEPVEEGPPQSGPHSRPQRCNASEGQAARAPLMCRSRERPTPLYVANAGSRSEPLRTTRAGGRSAKNGRGARESTMRHKVSWARTAARIARLGARR